MEDEDEFGDLYTDVLPSFASSLTAAAAAPPQPHLEAAPEPPPALGRAIDLNLKGSDRDNGDDEDLDGKILCGASRSSHDSVPFGQILPNSAGNSIPAGKDLDRGPRVLVSLDAKLQNKDSNSRDLAGFPSGNEDKEIEFDIEEGNIIEDSGPAIPGISGTDNVGGGGGKQDEDWEDDSDSEDDLQIVLNDNNHGLMGMERGITGGGIDEADDDDEDGDPLVIVADGSATQAMGEQDWAVGEDGAAAAGPEGERKEGAEVAGKGIAVVAPKIGYSNHAYPHPFHSQFKYVRPGAAPIPGPTTVGSAGAPGQIRPPISAGLMGRGRGDWRPAGVKGGPMQKGFHPGFGVTAWGSNVAGRGFGGGLEFTLPSHKTIFDVDIDSFEEKPWKYPGVDISDYFNFGLNEESWKDYCKQLEQHRLETTMQSKIRVYESGRAEQEYDPDLPPELAAATGVDVQVDSSSLGKVDAGQSDLTRGSARVRPPIPTGRPIQVESGYGERLPSIDTRPPRVRDSDAIIEIVLQDSVDDDSSAGNGVLDGGVDLPRGDFRGSRVGEDDMTHVENAYFDDRPQAYDSQKGGKRATFLDSVRDNLPKEDGVLPFPPEAPGQYHPGSRRQPPTSPGRDFGTPHEERPMQGRPHDKSSGLILGRSTRDRRSVDSVEEVSVESRDSKRGPCLSSPNTVEDAGDLSVEDKDHAVPDELLVAEVSSEMEKNEMTENEATTNDALRDGTMHQSMKKKIISHVEQPAFQELDDREDSRAARSSDNSKGRSGSSKDYQKRHGSIEEEVVQGGRSARRGSIKRHLDEHEQNLQRTDRDMRREMERNRAVMKGREGSYPHRDLDPGLANHLHMKHDGYDRGKERENADGSWQCRDEDTHSRKSRTGDTRKRERGDDMESRHRSKMRESMRADKDEYLHSKKQLDNGSYRVHYDKDGSSRHREKEDYSKARFEVVDDYSKRRKDEEYLRREHAEKEVILHGHREHGSRRRREREDILEPRKRDDQQRTRDNLDDYHSVRHKDEVWIRRERGERLGDREELLPKREREEVHGSLRSGRRADDKAWSDQAHLKDGSKVSDKEYQLKDTIRSSEPQKIRDRLENEDFSRQKGHDDAHIRGNPPNNEDRRSRQERSSSRVGRPIDTSDNQKVHEKKVKENVKRYKEPEDGDHSALGRSRRNQDDRGGHADEMISVENEIPVKNPSRRHKEEASSDDEQEESRRGRSKLERWTSHKERDYTIGNKTSASLKFKETNKNDNVGTSEASKLPDEPSKRVEAVQSQPVGEEKDAGVMDSKDADTKPLEGRHLDTVEKLKKRSERFKLPMPSDKDLLASKKENGALPSVKTETPTDSEIKPERPARKRRWISN